MKRLYLLAHMYTGYYWSEEDRDWGDLSRATVYEGEDDPDLSARRSDIAVPIELPEGLKKE